MRERSSRSYSAIYQAYRNGNEAAKSDLSRSMSCVERFESSPPGQVEQTRKTFIILSLNSQAMMTTLELQNSKTQDGSTHELLTSGSSNLYDQIEDYRAGIQSKYKPFRWKDKSN